MMAKKLVSDRTRFICSIIRTPTNCWEWQKAKDKDGYGLFKVYPKMVRAHRWSYEDFFGPIPNGMHIDHICCNKSCVNPNHLQVVTMKRNMQLDWERGTRKPRYFGKHKPDTIEKMRAKKLGKRASKATRLRMSLAQARRQENNRRLLSA